MNNLDADQKCFAGAATWEGLNAHCARYSCKPRRTFLIVMRANLATVIIAVFCCVSQAQKQALIVGQTWTSNMDGLDRILTITAVNYGEGTFAGTYGIRNSMTDELRGTFDQTGGNLVGWALSYRNGYLYGTQVWSGHLVPVEGTDKLAIKSLSIRSGPGNNPNYITSEYFVQSQEDYYTDTPTGRLKLGAPGALAEGQVWVNGEKDVLTISKVNSENGTFAGAFSRARDKSQEYGIRGEVGKDGSTLGWSVIYAYDDPLKLNYHNSIAWCGHFDVNHRSQKQEIYATWLNTTEYKQLQNFIVTNIGFDKFVLKSNETEH